MCDAWNTYGRHAGGRPESESTTMLENVTLLIFRNYLLAIALGALMGLERELKETRLAGLRTFILISLFGCICGQLAGVATSRWIVPAGILAVALQAVSVHYLRLKENLTLGLTTSVALLVAYGVGVLVAYELIAAGVALSLATTAILYFKPQLHDFTRKLAEHDIYAMLQFGLIAFIILPILPDREFGPYAAFNPYNIWLMVVMISALNLAGYIALKLVGQRWSGPVLGVLGGLVSSTATTLSFSRHAGKNSRFSMMGAVVVSLASSVVLIRIAILVGLVFSPLLAGLALPLLLMMVCGLLATFLLWRRTRSQETPVPETKNPAELKQALLFGALYAAILLAVSAGKDLFGNSGTYIVALLSGLTHVDAITLSDARLAEKQVLDNFQATLGILIAYVANLGFKLLLIFILGTRQMFYWTLLCFTCLALPALVVFL